MEEQFLLRWHCHETTLSKNLPALLEANILTDCTIAAGSKTYKAHKIILAACSTYFLDIFQNIGPLESSIIVLHDVIPEDVEAMLSYIYRGQCLVSKIQISRLVHLAKALKIQGLCNMNLHSPNAEYELENTQIEASAISDDPEPIGIARDLTEQDNQEVLRGVQRDSATKKALKDAPEICKCFLCGKYLSNQYNLRVHMETHKDTYYSCLSCPHVSKSRDALRKHVSYRHPEEYTTRKRKKHP